MDQIFKKKLLIWFFLSINLLFAFVIGFTIPLMESDSRFNLGFVMIPLLIILNYVFLDRFHYIFRHATEEKENSNDEHEK
ncbi:MAG: archaeosortase H N-terminal-like domain-containing protein [Promethearchaeota archaeon]